MDRRRALKLLAAAGAATLLPAPLAGAGTPTRQRALHWQSLPNRAVRCDLCPNACMLPDGATGICRVRRNRAGVLYTQVFGAVCANHSDPIEKKPLFHFLPGSQALSIATPGCNIACKFCQNWRISQFPPDKVPFAYISPADLVRQAKGQGAPTIAFTYSEPVVFYEYMLAVSREAKQKGIRAVMISNGYINAEPLRQLLPYLDAVKVDLKAFSEGFYRDVCRGRLQPVLDTLVRIKQAGKWLELVVLLIPGLNDGAAEIRRMSRFIAKELDPDVPVHFSRFHPDYKLSNINATPLATLERAARIAAEEGLHYAYVGNVWRHKQESTYCPACGKCVIERLGYLVTATHLKAGACAFCGRKIAGIFA